ncbi:MAG: outer membrane protein transport protein [Campylobacteraceae bacterium]|nr:outer membrane protein transport protein [Campylobacteraceae bacterium]
MKNILLKTSLLSICASSVLLASGWRIPEQNSSSIALSGAFISNSYNASSSYYNPANMSFSKSENSVEFALTYINLSKIKYKDADSSKNGESLSEEFIIPSIFYSSKDYSGFRYGASFTAPGGLSKRWNTPYAKKYAEEFTLKILEFNPVVSYLLNPQLAIAGGIRFIYSEGIVKSDGSEVASPAKREMEGDTFEYGYNLALAYKPTAYSNISLTYRSNIDIKEEGNAKLYLSGTKVYDGGSSVEIPLPAVLTLASSYTYKYTTIELVYDRTYWSVYKELDFEYKSSIPAVLKPAFDNPGVKEWKDTNAYRIGLTYKYSSDLDLMFGFAIDENPVPSEYLGFELPDSDAKLYSFGFNYKKDKNSTIGFGYLYDQKEKRTVSNKDEAGNTYINGTFTDASAHLVSVSYILSF